MRRLSIVWASAIVLAFAGLACGDEPPPFSKDPISLDRQSPSVLNFGNLPADIYGEAGGPLGGWDVGGPGPILHVRDITYGLVAADNNDGHSLGNNDPNAAPIMYFSGDRYAAGVAGTQYSDQANKNQAAGDRFVTNGWLNLSPINSYLTSTPAALVVWQPGLGPNLLSANQTRYNEIPTLDQFKVNPNSNPLQIDDMDALELHPIDMNGDHIHDLNLFFTLDGTSPSIPAGGSAADVFRSPAGVAGFGTWATAAMMGLLNTDDLDALVVFDMSGLTAAVPGQDWALFSLRPGNSLGANPSDVFVTCFQNGSRLYVAGGTLGMLNTDDVDGLDIETMGNPQIWDPIPEPSSLLALGSGMAGLIGLVLRRRRT